MIQQKYWTYGDLYSSNSLLLIADQLDHGQKRKSFLLVFRFFGITIFILAEVFFWRQRQQNHHCFDNARRNNLKTSELRLAVEREEDISRIRIRNGELTQFS